MTIISPPCPICGAKSKVSDTKKPSSENGAGWTRVRYYECQSNVRHSFKTKEIYSSRRDSLTVLKRNEGKSSGEISSEPFSMDKLANSLFHAATISYSKERCDRLAYKVAYLIEKEAKESIESERIGEIVLKTLAEENENAMWIRYALVFYKLETVAKTFEATITELRNRFRNNGNK